MSAGWQAAAIILWIFAGMGVYLAAIAAVVEFDNDELPRMGIGLLVASVAVAMLGAVCIGVAS